MTYVLLPGQYKALRKGPRRLKGARSLKVALPGHNVTALFAPRVPLPPLTVMVDHSLERQAAEDDRLAYLLSLLAPAVPLDADTPVVSRFWYADGGPPPHLPRIREPSTSWTVVPGWVTVDKWPADDGRGSIRYTVGEGSVSGSAIHMIGCLRAVQEEVAADSHAVLPGDVASRYADLVAAFAAKALGAHIYITDREYLFTTSLPTPRETVVMRPADALGVIGLYLRQQGHFFTDQLPDGGAVFHIHRGDFFWVAAHQLLPSIWRWRVAAQQYADATNDPSLLELVSTLVYRLSNALQARDRLHAALYREQDDDSADDVQDGLDQITLVLMAAFDIAARITHEVYRLPKKPWPAWKDPGWLKGLNNTVLAGVFLGSNAHSDAATPADSLLMMIAEMRNVIHGSLPEPVRLHEQRRSPDTLLGLPRPTEKTEKVLRAMDRLGGRDLWGVEGFEEDEQGDIPGTFIRPAPFVERLLPAAIHLLNQLLDAINVDLLEGVSLQPADSAPPLESRSPFYNGTAERFLWQLALRPPGGGSLAPDGLVVTKENENDG
jgi:hypothetical protein